MVYSTITSNRIAYEIDGTSVYYTIGKPIASLLDISIATPLTNAQLIEMNDDDLTQLGSKNNTDRSAVVWFFFPEKRNIDHAYIVGYNFYDSVIGLHYFQGSNDTTNGIDGTWENATFPSGSPVIDKPDGTNWRDLYKPVVFTQPYKVIRIAFGNESGTYPIFSIRAIHLYGSKSSDATPDDLVFCETDGTEITALNDFQDRPEASTAYDSFKVKNVSPDKTATNVNLNVTHADYLLSQSESGPWTAGLDFDSLAPDALTDTIYIKNEIGQTPQTLGPKSAKVVATVGGWT